MSARSSGRRAAALACAGLTVVVAAGCGSSSSDLSVKGAAAIRPYVKAVRVAAASSSTTALPAAVRNLKREAKSLVKRDEMSASRQADIDNAADALETDVKAAATPTPTPDESSSPPSTPPSTPTTPTTPPPTTESPTATATVTTTTTSTATSSTGSSSP